MKASLVGGLQRRFEIKPNKTDGILNYDTDNAYPQRILYTVAASGTGVACVNLLADYIRGRGFEDENFSKLILNRKGETADSILSKISKDKARYRGFALHLNYNLQLKISEVNFIPFEHTRLCIPDDSNYISEIAVCTCWDKQLLKMGKVKSSEIEKINVFNPDPLVLKKQIELAGGIEKYKGQVYWFSEDGTEYPVASCDAVLQDIESDTLSSTYTWRTLKTGFIQQNVFIYRGKFESEVEREAFKDNLENFQGADQSNQILLVESESVESDPEIKNVPVTVNDKMFDSTDGKVVNKIIRNYKQPLALHSMQQPGTLGLSREFEEAQKVYDLHTDGQRQTVTHQFVKVFKFWKESVTENFTIVPIGGLRKDSDKQPLATTLGVGGIQSLTAILSDQSIQPPQKINVLITVFGVPKNEAEAMVNGTPITE